MDKAIIDQCRETMRDLFEEFGKIRWDRTKDDAAKEASYKEFFTTDKTKRLMGFLVTKAKSTPGKFILGDKVSLADINYFVCHQYATNSYPAVIGQYPELDALYTAVGEIENVKKYMTSRKHGL